MKKLFKVISIILIQAMLVSTAWCGDLDIFSKAEKKEISVLSPRVSINTRIFQELCQKYIHSDKTKKSTSLPHWVNVEGLAGIKELKIRREFLPNRKSPMENNAKFDAIHFHISYRDKDDKLKKNGFIRVWVYKDPEGVLLFNDNSDKFNVRVANFDPKLPRGLGEKKDGKVIKAGVGISLLWLLFALEPDLQGKKALIYNAEEPSCRAFANLGEKWPSSEFFSRPIYTDPHTDYSEMTNMKISNVQFEVPVLSKAHKKEVNEFFENKVTFVDKNKTKKTLFQKMIKFFIDRKKGLKLGYAAVNNERIMHLLFKYLKDIEGEYYYIGGEYRKSSICGMSENEVIQIIRQGAMISDVRGVPKTDEEIIEYMLKQKKENMLKEQSGSSSDNFLKKRDIGFVEEIERAI